MKANTKGFRFVVLIAMCLPVLSCQASSNDEMSRAIQQYVCYDAYWHANNEYRTGTKLTATENQNQNNNYVWIEGLESLGTSSENVTFITLNKEVDVGWVVAQWVVFNEKAMGDSQDIQGYKSRVFNGQQKVGSLMLTTDCSPNFDQESPLKRDVLSAIEHTVSQEFVQLHKAGIGNLGPKTKVIIANFNLYYPETFVLVPDMNEIFIVRLRDSTNTIQDYLKQGDFPIGVFDSSGDSEKDLENKIIKNGIQQVMDVPQ